MASRGGAARAVRGGGKQVQELHGALRKLFSGFNWVEEGRRRGLRGGLLRSGGHGAGGGFWAAAGAWVVFGCAQGESGEVVVLLGAKEEEKELWWGRNVGGGRSVDGGELRRACARLSLAFKAAREREGSAGCRWRAALKAGRGSGAGRCAAGLACRNGGVAERH